MSTLLVRLTDGRDRGQVVEMPYEDARAMISGNRATEVSFAQIRPPKASPSAEPEIQSAAAQPESATGITPATPPIPVIDNLPPAQSAAPSSHKKGIFSGKRSR